MGTVGEEEFLCLVCRCNDCIGENFTCSLEYLRNTFQRCSQYFNSCSFGNFLRGDLTHISEVPLCEVCFSILENLCTMHQHLEKVQKCIADIVNTLNNEESKTSQEERSNTKKNLNEITLKKKCDEIVSDWNTIANSVKQEYICNEPIKTEMSDEDNDIDNISEENLDFELDCDDTFNNEPTNSVDLKLRSDPNTSNTSPQCGEVCSFTNSNGHNKKVVLKPFRVMLQSCLSTSNRRKSKIQSNSKRNTTVKSQGESMQVRKRKLRNVTNRLLTRAKATNTNKTYKCRICEEIFDNMSDVSNHIKAIHPNEKMKNNVSLTIGKSSIIETMYSCSICSLSFDTRKRLYYHKQEHSKDLHCNVCGQKFKNKLSLKGHIEIHSNAPFKCSVCDETFNFNASLNKHMISVHNEGEDGEEYACEICDTKFRIKHDLYKHLKTHRSKSTSTLSKMSTKHIKCKICGDIFNNMGDVRDHFDFIHPNEELEEVSESKKVTFPNVQVLFSCSTCNHLFTHRKALWRHKMEHSNQVEKCVCKVCGKPFKNKETLSVHMKYHSGVSLKCDLCDKSFTFKQALHRHFVSVHTDQRPFHCGICDKTFKLMIDLRIHTKNRHIKSQSKDFLCEDCGKGFSSKAGLSEHRSCHLTDRTTMFTCTMCSKRFSRKGNLTRHVRLQHTEEIICEICGKTMKNSDTLKFHMRIHTGEKPHQCSVCGKAFVRKDYLYDHMKAHSGEMMECPICGKSILNKSNFRKHMKLHNSKNTQNN